MAEHEALSLTRRLLDSVARRDWKEYQALCDPGLTCFEPEAEGALVEGLAFHEFYFQPGRPVPRTNTTIVQPIVRELGPDAAVVAYTRLVQAMGEDGSAETFSFQETRVWQRIGGAWTHVHFHRS